MNGRFIVEDTAGKKMLHIEGVLHQLPIIAQPYGQFALHARYDDGSSPSTNWIRGGSLSPQIWQHITMVRQYNDAFRLYVDGLAVDSASDTGASLSPPIVKLGKHTFDGELGLVGKFDEFRIYNRALSGTEIQRLYAFESRRPYTSIARAVRLDHEFLTVGTNYRAQVSHDLNTWSNVGSSFSATASTNSQYLDVGDWNASFA